MVSLLPIRPEQFPAFVEEANVGYAQDNVRAGRWTSAEALDRTRTEFDKLLPQGLDTRDHFIYEIRDELSSDVLGFLWFAFEDGEDDRSAYVYYIAVKPSETTALSMHKTLHPHGA